jgi:hypothetical protein
MGQGKLMFIVFSGDNTHVEYQGFMIEIQFFHEPSLSPANFRTGTSYKGP